MAKKAAVKKTTKTIEESLVEKFGDIFVSGLYISERKKVIVPVSPVIDGLLNGGVPFGSFVVATGPPKVGKTSFALDMAGSALNIPTEFDKPRHVYFFNIEGRLNARDLNGISSLRPHIKSGNFTSMESKIGNILSAEKFLESAEVLINEKPGSIFIFDSFSALCSEDGMTKEWGDGKAFRDNVPGYLSRFCKRISNVIPVNQSIVVGVTHQMANTGIGFSSWAEASGTKIQYQVDVKMRASHKTPWMNGETQIGHDVHWQCLCSPLHNGPTETKCVSKFRYGHGIDKETELVQIGVDIGVITKAGSWYTLDGEKMQGLEKVSDYLRENPAIYQSLNSQYREMMDLPC